MYRIFNKYAYFFTDLTSEAHAINTMVNAGDVVILVDEIDNLLDLGFDPDEIEIVNLDALKAHEILKETGRKND